MSSLEEDVNIVEDALRAFAKTMKRPQAWAHVTAQTGISLDRTSAGILHVLIMHEPASMRLQDLANRMGVEPPFVTRKTQLLEELGYLKRVPDPNDKRAIGLHVTAAGRRVAAKLWKAQRQAISQTLNKWPADDRAQFAKLLERFSTDLGIEANQIDNKTK